MFRDDYFKRKKRDKLHKLVAVLICASILLGIAPFRGLSFLSAHTQALEAGEEQPLGVPAANLITDGGFEGYASGTNLKQLTDGNQWYGISDSGATWPSVTASNDRCLSGTMSAKLFAMYNAVYRKVSGLAQNTDYIFSFSYYLPQYTDENLCTARCVSVMSGSAEVDYQGLNGALSRKAYPSSARGTGTWKSEMIRFNSGTNTEVYILFGYNAHAQSGVSMYVDELGMYMLSDCIPYYDTTAGSVTASFNEQTGKLVLTAEPAEDCYFRGWYCDATEVSANPVFDGATPQNAYQYLAEFYSYNLVEQGGFEAYDNGTDLRQADGDARWYGVTDGNSAWTRAAVTTERAHTGTKSLRLLSMYNTSYRRFSGLKKNTQYRISFYYNLGVYTATNNNYLYSVAVVPGSDEVAYNGNTSSRFLACRILNAETGGCTADNEWKRFEMVFFSGDNTEVQLCLRYIALASAGIGLYIDDLCLAPDQLAEPNYLNCDFDGVSTGNWIPAWPQISMTRVSNSTTGFGSGSAKITSTKKAMFVASAPVSIKKGCSYTFSFWVDLKDYPELTAEEISAYLDFAIITDQGKYGSYYISGTDKTVLVQIKNQSGTSLANYMYAQSRQCIARSSYSGAVSTGFFQVNLTFTADHSDIVYLALRLNEAGTVYLDNVAVTQSGTPAVNDRIQEFGLWEAGAALRMTDIQGLRYKTVIDKRMLCADAYFGARITGYGTLAIRSDILGDNDLILGGSYLYDGETEYARVGVAYSLNNGVDVRYRETPTTIEFTGVLMNIDESHYLSDYTMRTYIQYTDSEGHTVTVYSSPCELSVYTVAKYAYNAKTADGQFLESEATRNNLYDNVLSKATDRSVTVYNQSQPITSNFQGISATVYHCYTFMNDRYGRNYTDAQAAKEMNRLVDSGITTVRSIFKTWFAWDSTTGGWNWESDQMQAVYKWAGMLQDRGINIAFNAGWHLHYITEETSSIPEVTYLLGKDQDVYGESNGVDFTGMSDYEIRIKKASLRYGEWMRQALNALEAHGVYNVKYLLAFTEPSYATADKPEGNYADEWIIMTKGLHDALVRGGIRNKYQIVGPNQGSVQTGEGLLRYYLEYLESHPEAANMIDILSSHMYANSNTVSITDSAFFHDKAKNAFSSYREVLNRYTSGQNKEFWADEFFAYSNVDATWKDGNGIQLTQLAAGLTAAMDQGINRILSWQIFDQLWVNQTNTGGEFVSGVHACGTAPSFIPYGDYTPYAGEVPRIPYYGLNLLGKYLGNQNGTVYRCMTDAGDGLYAATVHRDDGRTVILAVNTTDRPTNVSYQLELALNSRLTRYLYDPTAITPTAEAVSIPSDRTLGTAASQFYDVLPAYSFALYVTEDPTVGYDVDLPMVE